MGSILLTGGTGYIGAHTAVALLQAGMQVVLADNLCNSDPDTVNRIARITGQLPPFYAIDIADRAALEQVFSAHTIDAVIHFAGLKSVSESMLQPLAYYRNNLDSTLTLLETMSAFHCHRIIFSSSANVYGQNGNIPFTESQPTGVCTNPYGRTKHMIEQILQDAAAADPRLSVVLLRYFNPLGAHESGLIGEIPTGMPDNLMPHVIQTAAGQQASLSVFGNDYPTPDGTGIRDYVHVTDLAYGHLSALQYALSHTGTEIFNLGTGRGYSVLEVLETFQRVNGVSVPHVFAPRRSGDIGACWADTEKAARILDWQAQKTLEDMCRDSWRFWCNQAQI